MLGEQHRPGQRPDLAVDAQRDALGIREPRLEQAHRRLGCPVELAGPLDRNAQFAKPRLDGANDAGVGGALPDDPAGIGACHGPPPLNPRARNQPPCSRSS